MWRKPVWTEGLFVSQHHFQVQDRYFEGLLRDRMSAVSRFDWGITELEIDERMLQSGQFALRKLSAIWPDGLVIRCGEPTGDPLPQPRPFDGHLRSEAAPLDVFIAMTSEGASNVALTGEPSIQQRFARVTQRVDDFNTGGAPQDVDVAVPSLRVIFGTEARERVTTMPIAQLVRQADGRIVARDTFVPPVMNIAAAPFLTAGLRRVVGAVSARQRELASARKQRHPSSIEFHFTDARRFWLLHTLNAAMPVLSHLLDSPRVHPEDVYLQLASLVGQLCTFAPDADPATIP
jgi:type VI secretion system protein ImpJ